MLDNGKFLSNLGFIEDPFAFTNAEVETRLHQYFVQPPYFAEVFGNPDVPQSFFVFAPRGGGKTAQRIMMERRCDQNDVLCLRYIDFDSLNVGLSETNPLTPHLERILKIGWLRVLIALHDDRDKLQRLTRKQAAITIDRIRHHLGALTEAQFDDALQALSNHGNRVHAMIDKHGSKLNVLSKLLNLLLKHEGLPALVPAVEMSKSRSTEAIDAKHELSQMIKVAQLIGYRSVYVVVDRVDESDQAGADPETSFRLIEPMIRSLSLLEMPGIAFKFFLPDAFESHYSNIAREDRVGSKRLEWTSSEMTALLKKRLMAHSDGQVWSLGAISEKIDGFDTDELAVLFANGSPRDLIRVCSKIVAEQQELSGLSSCLTETAIFRGIDEFCRIKCELEMFVDVRKHLISLQRIGSHSDHVDFTIPYLASDVFKESNTGSGNRTREWRKLGFIRELGTIVAGSKGRGGKVKLFVVEDVRLARFMVSRLEMNEFLKAKLKRCPKCNEFNIRDLDSGDSNGICTFCYYDWIRKAQLQEYLILEESQEEPAQPRTLHMFPELS